MDPPIISKDIFGEYIIGFHVYSVKGLLNFGGTLLPPV